MQKTLSVLCASAALALAASVLVTVPASANGGDFFNELAESWGANVDTGTPFFGFVRDERGRAIPRAIVTATVQRGLDGGGLTHVGDAGHEAPARRRRKLSRRFVEARLVATHDRDIGTVLGERTRDALADAASASGHEGCSSLEDVLPKW